MRGYEARFWQKGFRFIAGVDEAGRGSLAGPVIAAAVILPSSAIEGIKGLADSKRLKAAKREELFERVKELALSWSIGVVETEAIEALNILQATLLAMQRAIASLSPSPDYILIDGNHLPPISVPGKALPKGEDKSPSIAAASILAKVTRDRLMAEYHEIFPQYGFLQNKGYGTKAHLKAIRSYGPSPIHRRTFRGVRELIYGKASPALRE